MIFLFLNKNLHRIQRQMDDMVQDIHFLKNLYNGYYVNGKLEMNLICIGLQL